MCILFYLRFSSKTEIFSEDVFILESYFREMFFIFSEYYFCNPGVRAFIHLSAWFLSRSAATENCCQIQSQGRDSEI